MAAEVVVPVSPTLQLYKVLAAISGKMQVGLASVGGKTCQRPDFHLRVVDPGNL